MLQNEFEFADITTDEKEMHNGVLFYGVNVLCVGKQMKDNLTETKGKI